MPDKHLDIYAVLLAGGSGTRLWPVSRELYPKQLVNFIGQDSLVQRTIKRLSPVMDPRRIRIVCGEEHRFEIARHMEAIGVASEGKIISEPCGRNTAPAILLAVMSIIQETDDGIICVFPADHVIRDLDHFHDRLNAAVSLARQGYIVTFGITAHYPETGYGYIEGGKEISAGALSIRRFVEKPDRKTAEAYLAAGNYFWNSGMFVFKASVILEEFKRFEPDLYQHVNDMLGSGSVTLKSYQQLKNIAVDVAIMERTKQGAVLPSDFGWSDIGSWKSLYDFLPKDSQGNVMDGDIITSDTKDCFILGYRRLIATNHIRDMVVIETPDSVFVSDIDNSSNVKSIVEQLKQKGRKEYKIHQTVYCPWGTSTLLELEPDYQVDRLVIYPYSTLAGDTSKASLTRWVVVKGRGLIRVNGDGRVFEAGESVEFSDQTDVEIQNAEGAPLNLLKIQIGIHEGKKVDPCV